MESLWKVDLYSTPVYVQNIIIEKNINVKLFHNESRALEGLGAIAASINILKYS